MQELGDYTIIRRLGAGSLGAVYLAEHKFLKKKFVLKVLPKEFSGEGGFFERFQQAVLRLAEIDHPHIVKMHNVSCAEGCYFLVTEAVIDEQGHSQNLARYLSHKGGKMGSSEALSFVKQIASALDYAREKNLIHGFLKPGNILIGSGGEIKISDFGLGKILGEETILRLTFGKIAQDLAANLSSDPLFLENFSFLAPEQKNRKPATFATDVFAFGLLCHYLITGHVPEGRIEIEEEHSLWEPILKRTLSYKEELRQQGLLELLEGWSAQGLRPIEENQRESPLPLMPSVQVEERNENSIAHLLKKEPVVTEYCPEKNPQKEKAPLLTPMKVIPAGYYFRGSDKGNRDEAPRHQIYLPCFSIDIHPVTNEQFIRFLEYTGGEKDQNYHDLIRLKDSRISRAAGRLFIETGYASHPVVGVTWYGAFAYAEWVGKRLPTEAEWEIASAGGLEGEPLFPTGGEIDKTQAHFFSSDTVPVKSFSPNGYGLYDMAGNVYEWCHDWYGYNYYETSAIEPHAPKGPSQGIYRVLRGGCWKSLKEDLRTSHRHRHNPGAVNGTCGFRCAKDH